MANVSYVDAVGALREWINSRTTNLVGVGKPLQKGAHFRHLVGAGSACYAYLTLLPGTYLPLGAESPVIISRISAQVYGPTLEAVAIAAATLADELCEGLKGMPQTVALPSGAFVKIHVSDDITGPSDLPDGDYPRQIMDFNCVMSPA